MRLDDEETRLVREEASSGVGEAELRLKEVGGPMLDPPALALLWGRGRTNRFGGPAAEDTDSASLLDSGLRSPGGRVGALAACAAAIDDSVEDEDVFRV